MQFMKRYAVIMTLGTQETWVFLNIFQVGDFEKEAQTAMIEAKKEIAIKQREAKADGVGFGVKPWDRHICFTGHVFVAGKCCHWCDAEATRHWRRGVLLKIWLMV